jgi:hypothetical protein
MRIAYVILAHKLPEQLVRLVRKLDTKEDSFFIHIDKKADDETYKRISEPLRSFKNVRFLDRLVCNYGDFTHVGATLHGIQEIITSGFQYDYVILLTGQDYPIKTNGYIRQVLEKCDSKSFMEYFTLPSNEHWKNENGGLDRLNYWHFNIRGRSLSFPKKGGFEQSFLDSVGSAMAGILPARRKIPLNYNLFGGSAYWCLSRECIEYLNKFVRENAAFVRFFRHVLLPEEIFFQTVLLNSPLADRLVNDNLRCINWTGSWHPEIFRLKDFKTFINTDGLFARKFDTSIDAEVLDEIDRAIL